MILYIYTVLNKSQTELHPISNSNILEIGRLEACHPTGVWLSQRDRVVFASGSDGDKDIGFF